VYLFFVKNINKEKKMKKTFWILMAVVVIFLSFSMMAFGVDKAKKPAAKVYKFTMVIYGTPGNPFWQRVRIGVEETAKMIGCKVDVQFAYDDPEKQINIIETAITNKADGIGFIINIDNAYNEVIQKGLNAGIPMIAYNIDDSRGAKGSPRMAFIGQDFVPAGYAIGKKLIEGGKLKRGDHLVAATEHPTALYSAKRFEGIKKALDEVGITSEMIDCGSVSLEDAQTKITQYLLGHPETKATAGLGTMGTVVGPAASRDAGLNIPHIGFDITKEVITNILEGRMLATVDQQPYLQGAYTVFQLYLYQKYGLLPCDINTGSAIIDKSNAAQVLEWSDTVR
jgi:simple sugar transport system substrate-binding protein